MSSGPDRPYPTHQCVHQLFEEQVRRSPDAVALASDTSELTYAQLNARANRLAHLLRAAGAGPESLVGVCLERGVNLVVALLGVMKSGAAYVPLDPEHPARRTAAVLADSAATMLVTSAELAPIAEAAGVRPVLLDGELSDLPTDDPDPLAVPDNPAYVIFTSGSTGRPKGVVVPHRGVVNRLLWMRDDCGLTARSRVLQKTPATFDVSVWEFFAPLAVGATLVLARPGGHRDPGYLIRVLAEQRVDTVHFVPSMLRAFLAELRESGPRSATPLPQLRRVVCSGEALGPELVSGVHELLGCRVHNLYGPTEASVDVTGTLCEPGEPVTIGTPVANTQTYVLDPDGDPLPPGTPGELCLAGVQLARGYLGRPAPTAAGFRPNPFGAPGSRLYRTGDLVREGDDGRIEYLGRLDHQVKIRGFRIELGEIETALAAHPQVRAAVVAPHQPASGELRLVGYLVGAGPELPDIPGLRAHLGALLPDYMVPTAWVRLDSLPLTASGKTDRKALPAPDGHRPDLAADYQPPRTETESTLVGLWEEVLDIRPVGVHDRFLDLGGQSLTATRICSRLRRLTGVSLSPADLIASPTIEELAALLAEPGPASGPSHGLGGIPGARPGPLPLSSEQHRLWFLDQLSPGSTEYIMHDAHRLRGRLDLTALRAALDDTVRRHATLRTTFQSRRGVPHQVVQQDSSVQLDVVDLTARDPAEREELARAAVRRYTGLPFRLDRDPLLRMVVLSLDSEHHVLLAVVHHIVADDWSMRLLWRDLSAHYRARTTGHDAGLPPLPVGYADYAAWQRSDSAAQTRSEDLDHWLRHLHQAPPVLELPTDLPRPARQRQNDARIGFALSPAVTAGLSRLSAAAGATPFMTLLAAYAAVLARASGEDDLVIATFTANRTQAEVEDLIGLFVNTLPLRIRLQGEPAFAELLERTRTTALQAYRHQSLPFDQLVTALKPPRDLSRNPVAQVGFQTLGALADRIDLPGVRATPYDQGQGGHPFDVMVTLRENGPAWDGELRYPADLLTEAVARRLAASFVGFVEAATAERRPELLSS